MKNTACAKILFVSFLILLSLFFLFFPKWIGFVLGAIFVYVDQHTRNVELQ